MVKETYTHSGQKVTTYYKKTGTPVATQQNVSTSYVPQSGASKEEKLEAHASRRESNRALRDSTSPAPIRGTPEEYDEAPTYAKGEKRPKASAPKSSPLTPPAATGMPGTSGKKKQPPGGGGLPFAGVGQAFTELQQRMGPPDWISGGGGKKGKVRGPPSTPMGNVPGWVLSGKMPWEGGGAQGQKPVARTVITKTYADGTKTRSVRGPPQQKKGSGRPNWIRW